MPRQFVSVLLLALLSACGQKTETERPAEPAAGNAFPADAVTATGTSGIDAGKLKYVSVCLGCHGQDGHGQGPFPKLAGRPAAELGALLREYRAGKTRGPGSETMMPFAKPLTNSEIDALAAYLAAL